MRHPVVPVGDPEPRAWPRLSGERGVGPTLALAGLIGLSGLAGLGGPLEGGRAAPLQEPLLPRPASLAPVDTEAFRQRYGQEALFRLKLGVESGERSRVPVSGPTGTCEVGWSNAPQARVFQEALAQKRWYDAGEALGGWRRQCGTGAAPAGDGVNRPPL